MTNWLVRWGSVTAVRVRVAAITFEPGTPISLPDLFRRHAHLTRVLHRQRRLKGHRKAIDDSLAMGCGVQTPIHGVCTRSVTYHRGSDRRRPLPPPNPPPPFPRPPNPPPPERSG